MATSSLIGFLALAILAGALANVSAHRMRTGVWLYAAQSSVLALVAALVAYQLHEPHLYWVAGLVLLVKGLGIPRVMRYVMRQVEIRREVESFLGIPSSLLVCAALVALAYYAAQTALGLGLNGVASLPSNLLAVSLANVLVGFFIMINRKKALSQVIGLSVMENGLFLAALTLTTGMPLIIEIGVFFELLMGVMLMGILIFKIQGSFHTIDTHAMHTLRDY